MLNYILRFTLLLLFITLITPPGRAQTIGELFTADKADELFGEVITSVNIESSLLKDLTATTKNVLMFGIFEDELVITEDNRKLLYPENYQLDDEDVLHVWTTDIILELLEKGKQDVSTVEIRKDVLSLTNGTQTLEVSSWCPPFCGGSLSSK